MAGSLKPSDGGGEAAEASAYFDSSLALFPTRVVPAHEVVDLFTTTHAPDRIESYRLAMAEGERFPPVSVIRIGPRFIIADGHKRYQACRALGAGRIMVELWPLHKLLDDQVRQFRHKTRQITTVMARAARHPEGRKEARRLYWDTVGHWKRIALSMIAGARRLVMGRRSDLADRVFRRLLHDCLRFRFHLLAVFLSLAILGGAQLYLTWVAKLWAEGPLLSGNRVEMSKLLMRAAATAVAMVAGIFFSRCALRAVDLRLVQSLRDRAQDRLMVADLKVVRRYQTGDLMSRLFNDAGALSEFVREIMRRGVGESFVVVGATAMLFRLNWRLALVMGVAVPAVALPLARLGKLVRKWGGAAQQTAGELGATLNEQLHGLTTIKGFGAEQIENQRFVARDMGWRRHMMRSEFWSAALISSVWLIAAGGLLLVVWYGSRLVTTGRATAGGLLAFCLYAVQTVEPLRRLSEVHSMSQRAIACATRVYEVIDLPRAQHDGIVSLVAPVRGDLRFERVCLSFDADRPVLADFNLTLEAGETIALVGASGAGKSTIANLMLRFLEPDAGRILLDGLNLADLRLADLRRTVCVAEQDPFIFSGSLMENIRYGDRGASRARVEDAVLRAGLEPYVASTPRGLDAYVAESGRNLSGGQRQRIALARTIARDPRVLVLDEATSALDSDTERIIFANLKEWLERRTVIVMAHRLATVTRFARVAMLAGGAIIGEGSVADLLDSCAPFRELFSEQLNPVDSESEQSFG